MDLYNKNSRLKPTYMYKIINIKKGQVLGLKTFRSTRIELVLVSQHSL